jgi:hypothetical protein
MKPPLASRILEWIVRLLGALALGGFGGLLLWATGLLVLTPMPGEHPLAVLALRLFVLCVVGFLGLVFSASAVMLLVPGSERRLAPEIPRSVQRLCPGCGHHRGARRTCGACGLPPPATASHWTPSRGPLWRPLMLLPITAGIFAFGLFLLVRLLTEPGVDGSPWRDGFFLALALLTMGVGLLGAVGIFLSRPRQHPKADYLALVNLQADLPALRHVVQAEVTMHRGEIHRAQGSSITSYAPPAAGPGLASLPPEEGLPYRFLAVAALRGHLRVARQRRIEWSLGQETSQDETTASYRDAPHTEALTSTVTTGRFLQISLDGIPAEEDLEEEPERPARTSLDELLLALRDLKTVEHFLTLAREDKVLRETLQEQLWALCQKLPEEKIEREAAKIAVR